MIDSGVPFYLAQNHEVEVFRSAYRRQLAVLLKGPTGCGKTRFVRHMAATLGRPLYTVACHDELSATDLLGRYLIRNDETVWHDGPLTQAVRDGGICYLDEVVEARKDTTVILHPLCDDRRTIYLEKTAEVISAPPQFMLVVSFNPGYQNLFKNLKQSTRQRFVSLTFDFPPMKQEVEIVVTETGVSADIAEKLVKLGRQLRTVEGHDIEETASTRLLVHAAHMIQDNLNHRTACEVALVDSLTDDPVIREGLMEMVNAYFA
ncbi:MAG: CbbQ/NirQ/NorQ/GpvN family protein [Acidiferrobacterales bacterium]|nr:CbbQ/NirQ/NorQ/GpvN family protein [Acidiferrobacterales bacterium]